MTRREYTALRRRLERLLHLSQRARREEEGRVGKR